MEIKINVPGIVAFFLRPHMSLQYRAPIKLPDLEGIAAIQG